MTPYIPNWIDVLLIIGGACALIYYINRQSIRHYKNRQRNNNQDTGK